MKLNSFLNYFFFDIQDLIHNLTIPLEFEFEFSNTTIKNNKQSKTYQRSPGHSVCFISQSHLNRLTVQLKRILLIKLI